MAQTSIEDRPSNYPSRHSRIHRWLIGFAGIFLVAAAFLADVVAEGTDVPTWLCGIFLISGGLLVALGITSRDQRFNAALAKVSLVVLSTMLSLVILEGGFRVVGFDFDSLGKPGNDIPIYYRRPTVQAGDGVFRRPGPASWYGKVLAGYMRMNGANEGPYADEQPVLAEYDALGFRNPTNLTDWEMVVTGDSFVELGYLPYEELFTTLAGKRLGVGVKNLGVSGTGPISQNFYVKHYGKTASTKDAVLCFFEGNDLEDLSRELRNRESFRATGHTWEHRPQVSLITAVCTRLRSRARATAVSPVGITPNAALLNGSAERPMTVYGRPPTWNRLGRTQRDALAGALRSWADDVRSNGMRPWVVYLPDSHRVFHGFIRYTNSPVALWQPGEFASGLGASCTNLGIGFIDTFPALRREVEAGRVPYNLIGDTHLSREGSRVVAEVIADAFQSR
jgi:hypothetical protein